MRKKFMLAISAMILSAIMVVSLVSCVYKTENILDFKIEYLNADSKVETFSNHIIAIDDGNMYFKVGTAETYVIKNGETADVYITLGGISWTHENIPIADSPTNGLSDSSIDEGALEDEIDALTEVYRDFENNFTEDEDGYWYNNEDTSKIKGVKVDGNVCITKTVRGEKREQIGYSIVLPDAAKIMQNNHIL